MTKIENHTQVLTHALIPPSKSYSAPKPKIQRKGDLTRDKGKGIVVEFLKKLDGKRCFKCQGCGHF